MRLREFLFGTALIFVGGLVATIAGTPTVLCDYCRPDVAYDTGNIVEASASKPRPSAPSPLISQDKVLGSAYYDTVSILRSNNPCSDFFGGPDSVDILNRLVSKIRKDVLPVDIGMRMSGPTTYIHDARTQKHYRTFAKISLNSQGSFYRKKAGPWEPTVPRIGTFAPNTREARVLMLLHELGHVTKGADGQWLLPDDGEDEALSRANSYKIEDVCNDEIHSLGKARTMKDLWKHEDPDPQLVSHSKSERTQREPLR